MKAIPRIVSVAVAAGLLAYVSLGSAQQPNPEQQRQEQQKQEQQRQQQQKMEQQKQEQQKQEQQKQEQQKQQQQKMEQQKQEQQKQEQQRQQQQKMEQQKQEQERQAQQQRQAQQRQPNEATYLGVGIERLHPAFAGQFPGMVAPGQGLIVVEVAPNSPAAQAGLRRFDAILSFNGQKVDSPEQFIQLVQSAKPGDEATLSVLREGKQQEIKVKFGARNAEELFGAQREPRRAFRMPGMSRQEMRERGGAGVGQSIWENFDSLTVKSLGNDRFKADINFRTADGKVEHRTFEGTREEIRSEVDKTQDLPLAERIHVLRTLDLPPDMGGMRGGRF